MNQETTATGLLASFTGYFIRSKLTVLIIILSLVGGLTAVAITPREEDPTIKVAMADVLIGYPGQGAQTVDERLGRTVSAWIGEISTVEHVISSCADDGALFIVQFRSGVERETALTQLYDRLNANADQLPPGALPPLVKPRGIDDVPVLAVSLWSERDDPAVLRRVASELAAELRSIDKISRVDIIGGQASAIRVDLDAPRMADLGIGADRALQVIQASNVRLPAGSLAGPDGSYRVEAGAFIGSAADVESLIVGANAGGLVYMRDIARVREGLADPSDYVSYVGRDSGGATHAAVTLAAAKIRESNGSEMTAAARGVLDRCAKKYLTSDIHLSIVRDTGLTANHRVNVMLEHMGLATAIVVVLIGLALGWREAFIMAVLIPVMLAICPLVYYLTGFTLNRITLAAMIFVIGFLVDNAIVVMENIYRHFQQRRGDRLAIAVEAVREIGNPTTLATFIIIAALMPTAFVTGMSGQFMRPLPVGASVAMLYSLFIAFTIAPFLSYALLRRRPASEPPAAAPASRRQSPYRGLLDWIFQHPRRRRAIYAAMLLLLLGVLALIPARVAVFRSFPLNNADDLSVIVDLPPQATLEENYGRVSTIAAQLLTIPEITGCQTYAGVAGPLNFQGMARHYMMRTAPGQAEIQIQLTPAKRRSRTSRQIANRVRAVVEKGLAGRGANFTVAEPPLATPVQAALVAEIYGPEDKGRLALAESVRRVVEATNDVVDVDWTIRRGAPVLRYDVDLQKAATRGVMAAQASVTMRTLIAGNNQIWAHRPDQREPVPIAVRAAASARARESDLESIRFTSMAPGAASVPAGDIGRVERRPGSFPLMRKDLVPLIMVTAEVLGKGSTYAIIDATKILHRMKAPDGDRIRILWTDSAKAPWNRYAVRWGGEWTPTYDTLIRDLGLVFLVVLFLIYLTMVAWYDSSTTPLVIMLPIPLVMIGVIPGHLLFRQYLTGMSVMGVIALAGIMVRNSILLVDFARTLVHSGMPVKEAVLQASQTRLRPILLTSATVVLGDGVLFFDPLLQGLGITMSIGALVSTALTLVLVPTAYHQLAEYRAARDRNKSPSESFQS